MQLDGFLRGDVGLHGNVVGNRAARVDYRLDVEAHPVDAAALRVIDDLFIDRRACGDLRADPCDSNRIGAGPLQHGPRRAADDLGRLPLGQRREAAIHPFDAAVAVGDDDRVAGAFGDRGEFAQLERLARIARVRGVQLLDQLLALPERAAKAPPQRERVEVGRRSSDQHKRRRRACAVAVPHGDGQRA